MSDGSTRTRTTDTSTKFSERVRAAARRLGAFTAGELAGEIGVKSRREKRVVSVYIQDFVRRGEMERVDASGPPRKSVGARPCTERYRYRPKQRRVTNRQRLWNVVRRMPSPEFAIRDLEQITGIGYGQIKRFVLWAAREGWTVRVGKGRYRRAKALGVDCPADRRETK